MIKTVIFDNNGVLTTSCEEGALKKLVDYLGVGMDKFLPIWDVEAEAVDEGKITTEEFLHNVIDRLNPGKDFKQCQKYYWASHETKPDVREFTKELKKSFEIVFLTNFSDDFWVFNKKWKLDEIFDRDKMFISAELKMRKPHPDIYWEVLEKIGRKPDEVVFIDDKEENIETAQTIGMHAILFKSLEQVEKDFESILKYSYA